MPYLSQSLRPTDGDRAKGRPSPQPDSPATELQQQGSGRETLTLLVEGSPGVGGKPGLQPLAAAMGVCLCLAECAGLRVLVQTPLTLFLLNFHIFLGRYFDCCLFLRPFPEALSSTSLLSLLVLFFADAPRFPGSRRPTASRSHPGSWSSGCPGLACYFCLLLGIWIPKRGAQLASAHLGSPCPALCRPPAFHMWFSRIWALLLACAL